MTEPMLSRADAILVVAAHLAGRLPWHGSSPEKLAEVCALIAREATALVDAVLAVAAPLASGCRSSGSGLVKIDLDSPDITRRGPPFWCSACKKECVAFRHEEDGKVSSRSGCCGAEVEYAPPASPAVLQEGRPWCTSCKMYCFATSFEPGGAARSRCCDAAVEYHPIDVDGIRRTLKIARDRLFQIGGESVTEAQNVQCVIDARDGVSHALSLLP